MTKYILHGGNTTTKSKDNDKFFHEIIKDLANIVNLLIIYFSREEVEWLKLLEQDKENFTANNPNKKINFILASKNKRTLIKQIKQSHAIYMRGGEIEKLKTVLKRIGNLKELFKGKIVAGSSAGTYVLSRYYIDSKGNLGKGLGILPIKSFAHYRKNRRDELEKLKNYKDRKLMTYYLEEMKFVVLDEK